MENMDKKEMPTKGKQEAATSSEQIKPGRIFVPDVDIYETDNDIILFADVPGVTTDGLHIQLEKDKLTLLGEVKSDITTKENTIFVEYETGTYQRHFVLTELIDRDNINATLKDGVLELVIPKSEKILPKKIGVNVA